MMKKLGMYLGALGIVGVGAGFLFAKTEEKPAAAKVAPKMAAPAKPVEKIQVEHRIGFVNAQRLTEGYYRVTALNRRITDEYEAAQKQLNSMVSEHEELSKECQKLEETLNNPALNADAKKKTQETLASKRLMLEQKTHAIHDFKTNSEQRILQVRIEEGEKIATLVKQRIRDVAVAHGFTLVIDQENPMVFFADERFNITEEVLAKLNADQPAPAPVAAATH
ncbi:MAG: OmpH family outer membrane protein [Opitutales bacterium]|nr:OmpH family outer membrane protein [Opitutales bacterium]